MFAYVVGIFQNTPFWVYVIFCYLVYVGYRYTKTQVVSIVRLSIISFLFFLFSIQKIISGGVFTYQVVLTWLASIFIGSVLSFLSFMRKEIVIDKAKKLVRIPGSYGILITIFLLFGLRYCMGFLIATQQPIVTHPYFPLVRIFFSSLSTGLLLGRLLVIFKKYHEGPFEELVAKRKSANG